ncbi:MAG: hypothetical protein ACO3OO_12060, partial [Gemmobacter sp.]
DSVDDDLRIVDDLAPRDDVGSDDIAEPLRGTRFRLQSLLAQLVAQAAGLARGPGVEITDGAAAAAPGVPMRRFAEAAGRPGAPGQIAIGATVRIVFALSPP